jgi:transposase
MATERLTMRKTREILRQKWMLGASHRQIARSLGVGLGTVGKVVGRATLGGLEEWAQIAGLSEEELEAKLYVTAKAVAQKPAPDCAKLHGELRRAGVTLQLLHLEYLEQHPEGYRYTQFCEFYRQWTKRRGLSMRQIHRGGEKLFVDYAGKKPSLVDPKTGEVREVELFVAVLGASSYTYAEATLSQRVPEFIQSHVRALEFFGGVPQLIVPDQLKSGVTEASYYEPKIQRTYEEMALHYGAAVLPARPLHPKDKAKVEVGVQVVERWILARLRHRTFFTLEALNHAIFELTDVLNDRLMRHYGQSRRQLFEKVDKPALRPLPSERFVYAEWKICRVNVDYHVELDRHYYSVPHGLIHERLEARIASATVELFLRGARVASHPRSFEVGRHTTVPEHMPKAHQKHLEWSPSRLTNWAETIGPGTRGLVVAIMESRPHPEQGYRSCLGILRLGKVYGNERLEAAAVRALAANARSYRHLEAILKKGLDRLPLPAPPDAGQASSTAQHPNIRGRSYYQH